MKTQTVAFSILLAVGAVVGGIYGSFLYDRAKDERALESVFDQQIKADPAVVQFVNHKGIKAIKRCWHDTVKADETVCTVSTHFARREQWYDKALQAVGMSLEPAEADYAEAKRELEGSPQLRKPWQRVQPS